MRVLRVWSHMWGRSCAIPPPPFRLGSSVLMWHASLTLSSGFDRPLSRKVMSSSLNVFPVSWACCLMADAKARPFGSLALPWCSR